MNLSFLLYIDPGMGSYLFQLLIGLIAALIFYFGVLKNFIRKIFSKKSKQ